MAGSWCARSRSRRDRRSGPSARPPWRSCLGVRPSLADGRRPTRHVRCADGISRCRSAAGPSAPGGVSPGRAGRTCCRAGFAMLLLDAVSAVGMIGLGLLGHALAARLLAAGHAVVGHDLLPEKLDALARIGGTAAPVVADVTAHAEIICVVL